MSFSKHSVGIAFGLLGLAGIAAAQSDPGVRGGPAGAGGPVPGLTVNQTKFFDQGLDVFQEVQSVNGANGTEEGLGPRFNLNSCAGCHAQPAVGGTSPFVNPQTNPAIAPQAQITDLVNLGLINANGPVREIRFRSDGGVHDLFTIVGLPGTRSNCKISQPPFASNLPNIVFRIPTPTFGAGLIEAISDATILANETPGKPFGISGHANRSGNDGTVTRFGHKAQNKSLIIFSGEAYNVEQGITNEVFPNDRGEGGVPDPAACLLTEQAQDNTHFDNIAPETVPSDALNFANFMRFLAQPAPGPSDASTVRGSNRFRQIGCAVCHLPSMRTGTHAVAALANQTANLFSDILVHNMGVGLEDGVGQGNANGFEFRTAPLWGLGQRIFFLHDGRTNNLLDAISAHASAGSEANTVIGNFNALSASEKQDILNFLRSL